MSKPFNILRPEWDALWVLLGHDFYINDDECPEDEHLFDEQGRSTYDVGGATLAWQGKGNLEDESVQKRVIERSKGLFSKRDFADPRYLPTFRTLITRMRKQAKTVTLFVEVPKDKEAEVQAALKSLGCKVLS